MKMLLQMKIVQATFGREKNNMAIKAKTINNIYKNYCDMEKALVKQLNFQAEHSTTIGGYREEVWKSLFEQIIPKKFSIERSVFIIDSKGNVSNEVDLAIFDEQYTPYIFRYGTLKFIPIEAVAVVIECKSSSIDTEKISKWCESIDDLRTSYNSVARMASSMIVHNDKEIEDVKKAIKNGEKYREITQSSTRPIKILCCVTTKKVISTLTEKFDFVILASDESENQLNIICNNKCENLEFWNNQLNHYGTDIENKWSDSGEDNKQNAPLEDYIVKNNSILTLIFQLNQLLMLINNPLLFPHMSYVKMFNKCSTSLNGENK